MSICSTGLSDYERDRPPALPGALDADRIYSFDEFARILGISAHTLRRLIHSGAGPTVTWMSPRRGGIRGRHGVAWLDSRSTAPPAAA
jgi:hypothetical protein